jgi:hypothetical protein
MKNTTPQNTAIIAIILTKRFIYFLKTDSSSPEEVARPAIYPITVLSPVKTTIPLPLPYNYYILIYLFA